MLRITGLIARPASYNKASLIGTRSVSRVVETYQQIPSPTEKVPDVHTFLEKIGRNCVQHEKHFDSWEKLMTIRTQELKNAGVDTRDRR